MNYSIQILVIATVVVAFSITGMAADAPAVKKVGVDEFEKLWKEKKATVIDVRTPEEFSKGHIPGAVNIDIKSPDFAQKTAELDKDKAYLVHCAAGGRSARACDMLAGKGFKSLVDLTPGFTGWEKAGKPVEK